MGHGNEIGIIPRFCEELFSRADVARDLNKVCINEIIALGKKSIHIHFVYTVEPKWLEDLWDHGNSFETWVVQATEG